MEVESVNINTQPVTKKKRCSICKQDGHTKRKCESLTTPIPSTKIDDVHVVESLPLLTVLHQIYDNPSLLKHSNTKMASFLQKQGNPEAQGTGNKVTDQEACFAEHLESSGYRFIPKDSPSISESYYKYQPNNTQKSIDFEVYNKELDRKFAFDLKHSCSKQIVLNDGWFETGVIYIINWSPKKQVHNVVIGYGEDIRTKEEDEAMEVCVQEKKERNKKNKKVGSLQFYVRFANKYECDKFTKDLTSELFNRVKSSLTL